MILILRRPPEAGVSKDGHEEAVDTLTHRVRANVCA
jgi:hypothetical protein